MSVEAVSWALSVPVGGNAKVVLLGLANHAHPDGSGSYPALDTLKIYAHCDRSTVRRNLRKLEADGWIQSAGLGPKGQTKWSLPVGGGKTPRVAPALAGGGTGASEGVAPMPPEPSLGTVKNLTPSRPRSAAEVESSPQTIALCDLLASLIVANDPKATPSPQSKTWRREARLLLEKDGRDFEEAQRIVRWCQADGFWRSNILSMPKLRQKYAMLRLRMTHGAPAPLEQVSKAGRDKWRTWADQNVPELPVAYAGGAAEMIAFAGREVTPDAVRARVAALTFDLKEASS